MWAVKASRYRDQYPYTESIATTVSGRVMHAETSIKKKILGNFLDIVHFFAYCNHILLVLQHGYETGQAAAQK